MATPSSLPLDPPRARALPPPILKPTHPKALPLSPGDALFAALLYHLSALLELHQVAPSAQGDDLHRRIFSKELPQLPHVDIQRTGVEKRIIAPER